MALTWEYLDTVFADTIGDGMVLRRKEARKGILQINTNKRKL
jgi:hypothetical protein